MQPTQQQPYEDEFDLRGLNRGTYGKAEQEFLKFTVDVTDLLEDYEHRVLRGEIKIKDENGAEVWSYMEGSKKLVNEIGIRELMGAVIGKVNKAARLTYKDGEELYKDMFYFDMSITELIAKRSGLWELDIETAKLIKDSAVSLVWDIVAASRDGFTAINIKTQYTRSDITRQDGNAGSQPKSLFGFTLGGRK